MSKEIIFQQIRNSTEKVTYCGLNILVDPFFTPKGYYPGFDFCPTIEQKKNKNSFKRTPYISRRNY